MQTILWIVLATTILLFCISMYNILNLGKRTPVFVDLLLCAILVINIHEYHNYDRGRLIFSESENIVNIKLGDPVKWTTWVRVHPEEVRDVDPSLVQKNDQKTFLKYTEFERLHSRFGYWKE